MDSTPTQQDSPLSTTANIAGMLTFLVAILAAIYARITYLRNSDAEYFKVKTSLSWYKTESTWLAELVRAAGDVKRPGLSSHQYRQTTEYQMYTFVMDDLVRLEQRLLDLVAETEHRAGGDDAVDEPADRPWTLVPRSWSWSLTRTRTTVAMAWLPVRGKAMELVRQREALTARVLFTQMSMISSRIKDLEQRADWMDEKGGGNLKRLEDMIHDQQTEIRKLEDLIRNAVHRDHASGTTPDEGRPSESVPSTESKLAGTTLALDQLNGSANDATHGPSHWRLPNSSYSARRRVG